MGAEVVTGGEMHLWRNGSSGSWEGVGDAATCGTRDRAVATCSLRHSAPLTHTERITHSELSHHVLMPFFD